MHIYTYTAVECICSNVRNGVESWYVWGFGAVTLVWVSIVRGGIWHGSLAQQSWGPGATLAAWVSRHVAPVAGWTNQPTNRPTGPQFAQRHRRAIICSPFSCCHALFRDWCIFGVLFDPVKLVDIVRGSEIFGERHSM